MGAPSVTVCAYASVYAREREAYKHVSKQMLMQPTEDVRQMALYEFILRLNFTHKYHNGEYDLGHAHWMGHLASVVLHMDHNHLAIVDLNVFIQLTYFAQEHALALANANTLAVSVANARATTRRQRSSAMSTQVCN